VGDAVGTRTLAITASLRGVANFAGQTFTVPAAPPGRRRSHLDLRDDGAIRRHGSDDVRPHPEPGSKSEEGLNLLASWAATLHQAEAAAAPRGPWSV